MPSALIFTAGMTPFVPIGQVPIMASALTQSVGVNIHIEDFGAATILYTNADTPSGKILPFASTSTIVTGSVNGLNIANDSNISSIGPTSVTLNNAILGDIPSGTPIIFGHTTRFDTNADTLSGNILPFTSTAGIVLGYQVIGAGIPVGAYVTAITINASVTISQPVTTDVPLGTTIDFIDTEGYGSPNWENVVVPQLEASGIPWVRNAVAAPGGDSPQHQALYPIRMAQLGAAGVKVSAVRPPDTFTASIAPETTSITAAISGTIMTVTAISSGVVAPGIALAGAAAGTTVVSQLTGQAVASGANLSGGNASTAATGSYMFSQNFVAGNILWFKGTFVTAVSGTPSGNQFQIGVDLATSLNNLLTFLQASADANIVLASYALSSLMLNITYKIIGTVGNSFHLQAFGTGGGLGTYQVSPSQTLGSTALTSVWGLLTVTAINGSFANISPGDPLFANNVITGTTVLSQITDMDAATTLQGKGTYAVSLSQTVASEFMVHSNFAQVLTANYLASGSCWGNIEGPNEPFAGQYIRLYQQALWSYVQSDPVLGPLGADVTIAGPGMTAPDSFNLHTGLSVGNVVDITTNPQTSGVGIGSSVSVDLVDFTASMASGVLNVSSVNFPKIAAGMYLTGFNGGPTGLTPPNTHITNQVSGTPGGAGFYSTDIAATFPSQNWSGSYVIPGTTVIGTSSSSVTLSIPIAGPIPSGAAINFSEWGFLGDLSPYLNYGNIHPYQAGNPEDGSVESYLYWAAPIPYGSNPIIVSECGWTVSLSQNNILPVPVTNACKYLPRLWLWNLRNGSLARTFYYQLMCNRPINPADPQAGYGLINYNGDVANSPQWLMLSNLMQLFSDPGPIFTTTNLAYSVTGGDSTVYSMLFQKRNGLYLIPVWVGAKSWNPQAQTPIPVPPQTVTITVPSRVLSAQDTYFNPDGSLTTSTVNFTNGQANFIVTDDLQVLSFN